MTFVGIVDFIGITGGIIMLAVMIYAIARDLT